MLDLKSSHEFWKNFEDPMIYRVIAFMETVEGWTKDGDPNLEAKMNLLGDELEKLSTFELEKEEQFVTLCAHIKSSRILRLLQAIDTIDPGSASKLLMYAEEHNSPDDIMANLFLPAFHVCARVLRPGGKALISVPYDVHLSLWWPLYKMQCFVQGTLRGNEYYKAEGGHIQHFSMKTISEAFEAEGFRLDERINHAFMTIFLVATCVK